MNKIYLAGRYERRAELAEYAEILSKMGNEITASWLDGKHEADDKNPTEDQKREWVAQDLADIRRSDLFLAFTDNSYGRGGRHFECGYAEGKEITICVIGEAEDNIFYADYGRYENFAQFLSMRGKGKE